MQLQRPKTGWFSFGKKEVDPCKPAMTSWRVIGRSVRGASHVASDLPNQDAILWHTLESEGSPVILAVADGHGSPKSFRSQTGASFAVEVAIAECRHLLSGHPDPAKWSLIKGAAEEHLPKAIIRAWEKKVGDHLRGNPFSADELDGLAATNGLLARQMTEANPRVAYGATLLAVIVTDKFLLCVQQGDGDILTVADDGEVSRPLPRDERFIGSETTSLCMRDAVREFRVAFQVFEGAPPAMVVLSTDGYANSFLDDRSFLKMGADLLTTVRREGLGAVDNSLEDWLSEASEQGSGDDITIGVACRADIAVGELDQSR